MATHSSILAWRIPWTEEPDGLQSIGWRRVGYDWARMRTHTMLLRAAPVSWRKERSVLTSDRDLVGYDPSWGILRNSLFCGQVTDYRDAPATGLQATHRRTSKQITVTERSFIGLSFPFSRGRKTFVWLPKIWLSILPPLSPSHPHLSSLTTFWFKVPDSVTLPCSHARPVLPAPQTI